MTWGANPAEHRDRPHSGGSAGCGRCPRAGSRRGRDARNPMPPTRSTRPTTPAAAPPARWGPATAALYPVGGGFGQNYAGGKIFFTPDTGAHIMARRDPAEVPGRSAGPPTATWAFPPSTRATGKAPGQPQHHVQRGRQARHLLDARHRVPMSCAVRSTRRGTSSADRRGRSGFRPRTRSTTAMSSRRSSPAARCRGTGRRRSSPRCRPIWRGSWRG